MQCIEPTDFMTIECLKRQARRMRLEANRASTSLAAQFIALAELYESQAVRREVTVA
ncbi:MAG TPA: hypothetical protein VMU87_05350 [Stellaceae bacterium]|nr:hypothetical protein [Stellaceae bacterium]